MVSMYRKTTVQVVFFLWSYRRKNSIDVIKSVKGF